MLIMDWLSSRKSGARFARRGPPPRRRVAGLDARDALLEDRCLLSGSSCRPIPSRLTLASGRALRRSHRAIRQADSITNNGTETIYPFLEDANNRTATSGDPTPAPNYTGTGMFDPFDPINQEYRGYIGYTQQVNGQTVTYMGLLPGDAITINVPLVFWDAGRIIITTDSADLLKTGTNGDPFLYRARTPR